MPIVKSHPKLLAAIQGLSSEIRAPGQGPINPVDQTNQVCQTILEQEAGLVADVAVGRAKREALIAKVRLVVEKQSIGRYIDFDVMLKQVMDTLFGYGPLQPYIEDESITDIDGTGPAEFTVKTAGQRKALSVAFRDAKAYDTFCRLMVIRNGGVINENDSHCRVTDERYRLRINVAVPPRSVGGPTICIRKHRQNALNLEDLRKLDMFNSDVQQIICDLAQDSKTILICGKGAAGKTTLLRALIESLPRFERVLIAESDCELFVQKPYCLTQKIKKPESGGRPVSLHDLVSDGLTMSLDTYCIGEITGPEAMDMIRAAYSGHRCLATTHANSAEDALDRLLSLARPASCGEDDRLLSKMLAAGIDAVIHLDSFKVNSILTINGFSEGEGYVYSEIWGPDQNPQTDHAADQHALQMVRGA